MTLNYKIDYKGANKKDLTYEMSCMSELCSDDTLKHQFETVYWDSTNKAYITYWCMDIA